jgi:histone H3/H4
MENMKHNGRKSINSADVFKAMETLELDQSILSPVKEAVTSMIC